MLRLPRPHRPRVGRSDPAGRRALGRNKETRRIAALAFVFNIPFAPHVGFSGAVCVAASLQLCAAIPNFLTFECMTSPTHSAKAWQRPTLAGRTI